MITSTDVMEFQSCLGQKTEQSIPSTRKRLDSSVVAAEFYGVEKLSVASTCTNCLIPALLAVVILLTVDLAEQLCTTALVPPFPWASVECSLYSEEWEAA